MTQMRKYILIAIISLIGFQARSEIFLYPDETIYTCSVNDAVINGTETSIVCILEGESIKMDLPSGMRLKGIDSFGDGVIAIADDGYILYWDSPFDKARKVRFNIKGNFISLDAGAGMCYVLSDSSEIISLNLALQGKVFDFNANYSEYYGTITPIAIAAGPNSACLAVLREDGTPTTYVSSKGTVWSERDLDYAVNGKWFTFKKVPHSITYEELSDCFVLHCEDGDMFYLPNCSHCNYVVSATSL